MAAFLATASASAILVAAVEHAIDRRSLLGGVVVELARLISSRGWVRVLCGCSTGCPERFRTARRLLADESLYYLQSS